MTETADNLREIAETLRGMKQPASAHHLEMAAKDYERVREALTGMVAEFKDYHYHGCPKDSVETAKCNCFAGLLTDRAKAALISEQRNDA